jgi:hypothetical protein
MAPFKPAGARARWKVIYDLLSTAKPGETVSYEDMAAKLDLDAIQDRHAIQMAVRRAAREYLTVNLNSLKVVPNVGYAVIEPSKKLALAEDFEKKGRKAIRRGKQHVDYVDVSALDDDTRQMFEIMAWKFGQQDEAIRRLSVKQNRMQRQVEAAVSASQQTSDELTELRARLEKLEGERKRES